MFFHHGSSNIGQRVLWRGPAVILGRWDHMALIDYQTRVFRISIERLRSTANCFLATGIGDESLTLHSQGGETKLVDLPCSKTIKNFLASIMKNRSRVKPIGTRESRENNSSLDMLPSSSNQLEGELDISIPAIDDSRRVNRQERRPRRRREPIIDRIGSAIDDTLMDAPRNDEDEVQHDEEQEVVGDQNVEN